MIDGVIPAAGSATRMRGLPKFLLPAGPDSLTLIETHVSSLLEFCDKVWIPTRPEQVMLIDTLGIQSDRVVVVPMRTQTMTETIKRVTHISNASRFIMVMPDTYFSGEMPYEYLAKSNSPMNLACWNIRGDQMGKLGQVELDSLPLGRVLDAKDKMPGCEYPHSWGAMAFDRNTLDFANNEMQSVGHLLPLMLERNKEVLGRVMNGKYFDCGTQAEYITMLTSQFG